MSVTCSHLSSLIDPKSWQDSGLWDFPGSPVVKTSLSHAGGTDAIPGWGAKIPHASQPKNQNIKQKQYCNKFNRDLKNGPHQKKSFKKKKGNGLLEPGLGA